MVKPKNVLPSMGFPMIPYSGYARLLEGPYLLTEFRASTAMGNDERVVSGGCGRLDGERRRSREGVRGPSELKSMLLSPDLVWQRLSPGTPAGPERVNFVCCAPYCECLQSASPILFPSGRILSKPSFGQYQCLCRSQNKGPATG
jgi:hypothetical protein